MSEDMSITHHGSRAWSCDGRTDTGLNLTTEDWAEVTCGPCKLEAPMQEVPGRVEYRTPNHVIETDKRLAEEGGSLADVLARHAERRLATVRKIEETAARAMAHWTKTWQEAVSLRVSLERGAGVPTEGVGGAGAAEGLSAVRRMEQMTGRILRAPVNAVDIRTDEEYAQDMKLSSEAQSALIDVNSRTETPNGTEKVHEELRKAGLVGPNGGLTSTGYGARRKLMQAREDAAFG